MTGPLRLRALGPSPGLAFVLAILACALASPSLAAVGTWAGDGNARVRLVASGVDADGRLDAGIEIELAPGWKTYWRTPGDAGIPPLIDISASANLVGPPDVAYPLPRRLDDGYAVSNVYEGRVVLPLAAKVAEPAMPVSLAVSLDIGVCDEICIPAHFDLALDISPGARDPDAEAILAGARAALPGKPEPGVFAAERIVRDGGTDRRPVFSIAIVAPEADRAEIFVEGPVDWFPAPPELVRADPTQATYRVEFSRSGAKTPIGGNEFRVTVVSAGRAVESLLRLD